MGPTGPHLFRYSFESPDEPQIILDWSPIDSPQRAGPSPQKNLTRSRTTGPSSTSSVPLERWSPPQVADWARAKGLANTLVQSLLVNDISGVILRELKFGDLKELGIDSFGQRHQLWDEIRQLRGSICLPSTSSEDNATPATSVSSNQQSLHQSVQGTRVSPCSNPPSPEEEDGKTTPALSRRRARRALRADDVISPAESASIVAIEQLLPRPHHCSKGENCAKWRKQQRQLARIAKEFPLELEQIEEANASPTEATYRPTSEALPSVVASSDVMGPALPTLRLDEEVLRVIPPRDPQENVRQFLDFQHINRPESEPSSSPVYEMFPPLSPPANTQAPHSNLSKLPKLRIPLAQGDHEVVDADRTIVRQTRSPITAVEIKNASYHDPDVFRIASPASAMDVPLTAIPSGPVARDESQSVPPNMQYGGMRSISRSNSRGGRHQWEPVSPILRPQTASNSTSDHLVPATAASHPRKNQRSRRPSFAMAPLDEVGPSGPQDKDISQPHQTSNRSRDVDDLATPTVDPSKETKIAGWMKKRKTKMLRHEWQENHFRLNGTRLAMHRNSKALEALDYIDIDDYAVACSSMASNRKLSAAFKSLKISGGGQKKKDLSVSDELAANAFCFQLVPSTTNPDGGKAGLLAAAMATAGGKSHHFAVKTQDERINWMRELMLAKALKEKVRGAEVNLNGNMI